MKKRLLLVTDIMSVGGVEKVIVNTLNGLDPAKFDVTLFILYKTEGEKSNLEKIPGSVKIQYGFTGPVKGIYKRMLYYLIMLFPHAIMKKLLVKDEYDIIVTTKDLFTYPFSAAKGCKVMWIHGGLEQLEAEDTTIARKFIKWFKERTYRKFDEIIILTNVAKGRFCNKYKLAEKCHVINNPINHHEIVALSSEGVSDYEFKSKLTIVCTCRLSIEKGVDRLVNACGRLLDEGYDFNLLIVGDGPEKTKIKEIIFKSKALTEQAAIIGFRDNPYKYMSRSTIYVSPSHTEGFSLSLAEAIVLGLPVLSTDCKGNAEMLGNGEYGLLVENSEEGICEGLRCMLSKPELIEFYRKKSNERKEFFAFEKNIRTLEMVISGR